MKNIKKLILTLIAVVTIHICQAQNFEIAENTAQTYNGFEYSYTIVKEQTKDAYNRFEIQLTVTNKSGCTKLYTETQPTSTGSKANNKLAELVCVNATGKRLTSKKGSLDLKPFYVVVKTGTGNDTKSVKTGYQFRNGDTITNKITVIVPLNERPKITCNTNLLLEL